MLSLLRVVAAVGLWGGLDGLFSIAVVETLEDISPCAGAGMAGLLRSEILAWVQDYASAIHRAPVRQPEPLDVRSLGGLFPQTRAPSLHEAGR